MTTYLSGRPEVRRLGRYEYALDGRAVDFTAAITPAAQAYPIS
jgi:alpha-galactosidase